MSSSPANYRIKPPTTQVSEIEYSYRLKRAIEGFERRGLEYLIKPNPEHPSLKPKPMDLQELLTIRYKQKFPDDITTNIAGIYRILLEKPNMFEFENGEMDTKHKVKQALVYGINEYVDNPQLEHAVGYHTTIGSYNFPIIRYGKHDEMGNAIPDSAQVMRRKNIFYIEYTPEKIDEILEEMDNQPNTTAVAIAEEFGTTRFKEPSYTVHNIEEFKTVEDLEGLIDASKKGYLRRDFGGYKEYLDAKEEAKKAARPVKSKVLQQQT